VITLLNYFIFNLHAHYKARISLKAETTLLNLSSALHGSKNALSDGISILQPLQKNIPFISIHLSVKIE